MRVILPLLVALTLTGVLHNLFNVFHVVRLSLNLAGLVLVSIAWSALRWQKVALSINIILYSALAVFSLSVLLNGGVRAPNYIGFLGVSVLASIFSSTRFIWGSYIVFMVLGGLCLVSPIYDPETISFPPEYRYYTIYGVIGLVISISLVKTRESFNFMIRQLADRESLLSSVLQSITDPLLIYNDQLEVTYLNEKAQRLNSALKQSQGLSLSEVMLFDMGAKEERSLKSLIEEASAETKTFKVHVMLNRNTAWYSVACSPYSSSTIPVGTVVVIRDITEQQRLTHHQKMGAVGRLSNGIAHDFNNMLGAIKSANDLLKLDLDEEHHELLEMIDEGTERSANLIKQLRLFSKRSDSEETIVDLRALTSDVTVLLQSVTHHSHLIESHCGDAPIYFQGVKDQLHSMLMNLGLNGLQSMTERGTLSFRIREEDAKKRTPYQRSSGSEADQYLIIEVSDEGLGISPDLQEQIFEPFFTTRDRGEASGIGLSIVHGAVERHGGSIEVISQMGRGTTMRITLPKSGHQNELGAEQATPVVDWSFDGCSVLVIDDEPLIRQSLIAMLQSLGLKVTAASCGEEGLELLRESVQALESSSDTPRYDVVILDMLMPGKNGHEVFLEMREIEARLPVILSSGFYPEEALSDMVARGLAGQLHKPYGLEKVKKVVSRVLSERS